MIRLEEDPNVVVMIVAADGLRKAAALVGVRLARMIAAQDGPMKGRGAESVPRETIGDGEHQGETAGQTIGDAQSRAVLDGVARPPTTVIGPAGHTAVSGVAMGVRRSGDNGPMSGLMATNGGPQNTRAQR